jgi:hypothetical protein
MSLHAMRWDTALHMERAACFIANPANSMQNSALLAGTSIRKFTATSLTL